VYSDHINQTVIQHEVAHQVLFNAGVHVREADNPKWLVEGLACLFETPPGATGTGASVVNQSRLRDFRSAVAGEREKRRLTARDLRNAIVAGRIAAVGDLVSDDRLFHQRGEAGATHYATVWALVHYLQRQRREELADYIREIGQRPVNRIYSGEEERATFARHFGQIDDAWLDAWGRYILRLRLRATGATF
jgi:hypothetical protein